MRLNFRFISLFLLSIAFLITSCKSDDTVGNYQIENKLNTPINVRFIGENYAAKNIDITIESNEIKDVIVGVTGFDGAYGLHTYDSAFIEVSDTIYIYTKLDTVGLLDLSSYVSIGSSKKKGEVLSVYKLIVDNEFLLKSSK